MDHSELVAPELARRDDESDQESETDRAIRVDNIISGRVPDVRFLVDHLLGPDTTTARDGAVPPLNGSLIGLVGHSLGGWTILSTIESDARVASAVALAPGGSSRPMPGVLALTLTFGRQRDVSTLFLGAADDTPIPLDRVTDVFDQSPGPKRMFVLARADHHHFVDAVAEEHEATRASSFPGAAAWIPAAMRPFAELASAEQAHLFVRGLTLAHFDATLRALGPAEQFLTTDVEADLTARGVDATRFDATRSNPTFRER
jgi:dienelactone hydrolase